MANHRNPTTPRKPAVADDGVVRDGQTRALETAGDPVTVTLAVPLPTPHSPLPTDPAPGLPPGVVLVTLQVPVFTGELTGYRAQNSAFRVDGRLGLAQAQTMQRVLLGLEEIRARQASAPGVVRIPSWQTEVSNLDTLRFLADRIAAAIAVAAKGAEHGS